MKLNFKHTIMAAVLASSAVLSTGTAAHADIEDWLRNTFSSRDWVGDWLKDTFGPMHYDGGKGDKEEAYSMFGKGGKEEAYSMFAMADKITSGWAPGEKIMDREKLAGLKPVCKLPELLGVVIETKSPEALLEKCFAEGK